MINSKRCTNCGEHKKTSDFPNNKEKRDGLYSWCKQCTYERNSSYQKEHPRKHISTGNPKGRPKSRFFCEDCSVELPKRIKRCDECKTRISEERAKARQQRRYVTRRENYSTIKAECIAKLGGKCTHCGYDTYVSGLSFHHLHDKSDSVGRFITDASISGTDRSRDILNAELEKCILLCFNCHMALHAGEWKLT